MSQALIKFPPPVIEIIAWYNATYQFEEWVKLLNFPQSEVKSNISRNPMAMDVICYGNIKWNELCENSADWAVDLIIVNQDKIRWYHLARNSNPRAFALVKEYADSKTDDELIDEEVDEMLSGNPLAIALLRSRPRLINNTYLMWNPAAEDLIRDMNIPIDYSSLAGNSAPWAVHLLLRHGWLDEIPRGAICGNENPRIFQRVVLHPNGISWRGFSANPLAIHHLRAQANRVRVTIYSNPAAIQLTVSKELIACLMEL